MRIVHKRRRDGQRAFPAAECALCGGELYRGESSWRLNGRTLCQDCAARWVLEELAPWRRTEGVRP